MDSAQGEAEQRLQAILAAMGRAEARFGVLRQPARLVAVSKTFDVDAIEPFIRAGQRVFGENRVQEARDKWPELKARHQGIELHLIGPLQTNKARDAVALFDVIETLDREKLALALRDEMAEAGRQLPLYVQVNIGAEPQKAGVAVDEAVAFTAYCRNDLRLDVVGLMCIPPDGMAPGPYFAQLAGLAQQAGVDRLSMGMSGDFETAIAMGATEVRVGSALFGRRD